MSEETEFGYDMDMLLADVVELIKKLKLGPCHVAGSCMGGFVALRLAIRHRELVKSLILIGTSAETEPLKLKLNSFKIIIRYFSVSVLVNKLVSLLFSSSTIDDPSRQEEMAFWKNTFLIKKKSVFKALGGYIDRPGISDQLGIISMPTLILVGEDDKMTSPQKSKNLKLNIPQATLSIIKEAGHAVVVDQPWKVTETMEVFLNGVH